MSRIKYALLGLIAATAFADPVIVDLETGQCRTVRQLAPAYYCFTDGLWGPYWYAQAINGRCKGKVVVAVFEGVHSISEPVSCAVLESVPQ